MFRTVISACTQGTWIVSKFSQRLLAASHQPQAVFFNAPKPYSVLAQPKPILSPTDHHAHFTNKSFLLEQPKLQNAVGSLMQQPSRTLTKFSRQKGKRQTVKSVPARFKRLDWGIWIRRFAGAHKKLWKRSQANRNRMDQHVFCSAGQSYMLDKMVAPYWRTPKYWVDDPYAPYHKRENFHFTKSKPSPLPDGTSYL